MIDGGLDNTLFTYLRYNIELRKEELDRYNISTEPAELAKLDAVKFDELDRLAADRGYPAVVRCDNGPELACTAMADWAGERVGLAFIPPGEPWRNGYIESFNGRLRDECLNIELVLVPGPCPGHHHRLEERVQPAPTTLSPRLPSTSSLR